MSLQNDFKELVSWMPPVLFASLMSIISLSNAQIMLYKKKHEFDMSFLGGICYFLSATFLIIAKLSAQIMIVSPMNAYILYNDFGFVATAFLTFISNFAPFFLHNIKDHLINYWYTLTENAGYYLEDKFLPTSLHQVHKRKFFPEKDLKFKWNIWINWFLTKSHKHKNWTWYYWFCFGGTSYLRRLHNPEVYQFSSYFYESRIKYRKRFSMALGNAYFSLDRCLF